MILTLTALGLILIPLYELIFRLFPSVEILSMDTRYQKEIMAIIFALAIGLLALYQGKLKPFKNKWLLFFIGLQMVTINLMPKIPIAINGAENSGFWVWKPMFQILCFLLMGAAIASAEIDRKQFESIFKIVCLVAFVEAVYVILQTLGMDQFYAAKPMEIIGRVQYPGRAGNLGQPTLVSPFIAMVVPIAFYLRKYILAIFMLVAIYLTDSQRALGALVIGLLAYLILRKFRSIIVVMPAAIISAILLFNAKLIHFGDSGRINAWKMVLKDILNTPIDAYAGRDFSFFGHGLGSFRYLSSAFESTHFAQVHNEYLEIFYSCGIFGIILFLLSIFYLTIKSYRDWRKYPDYRKSLTSTLFCSFLIISLCALGTFVWQLGAHTYYTVVIVGLLLNENIGGEKCLG